MARTHYELGVRMRQRHLPTVGQWRFVLAAVVIAACGTGYGALTGAVQFPGMPSQHVESHRRGRPHNGKKVSILSDVSQKTGKKVARLVVRQAAPSIPNAAASLSSSSSLQPAAGVVIGASLSSSVQSEVTQAMPMGLIASGQAATASNASASNPVASPAPSSGAAPTVQVVTASPVQASVDIVTATQPTITLPPIPVNTAPLDDTFKKEIAMELVSSAENSSLDWKAQYAYIEDIGDGRGYTGGIIGFCSGTGDMLEVVQRYAVLEPGNALAKYIPALQKVNGTSSHTGLGDPFVTAWKSVANDPLFRQSQDEERDKVYFNPAVSQAKADGLRALGQFIYYDAIVMHGPGTDAASFGGIRATAMKIAKTPAQGGNETAYLNAFLDARVAAMKKEAAHDDTSRVDTEQRVFLQNGNLDLNPPLTWKTYGDTYTIN